MVNNRDQSVKVDSVKEFQNPERKLILCCDCYDTESTNILSMNFK